jgi:hypothetical protein
VAEMCLRRTLLALLWLVGVLYLVRHPVAAAHTTTALMRALGRLADALGRYGSAL